MKFSNDILRLYAVTDRSWVGQRSLFDQVEEAIKGGATCIQLREKSLGFEEFLAEAKDMAALCHRFGVPLLINDQVEIARQSGADGVHVGQDDMCAQDIRREMGGDFIIGVTAKTIEQALAAQEAGANYLGSGAVFGSTTKQNAKPMTRETLRSICDAVSIPVIAIGGINAGNIEQLAGTHLAGVAIVSGIFAAADIEAECRKLLALSDQIRK